MADAPQGRIVEFDGKTIEFPSNATDAQISAALKAIPASNSSVAPKAKTWSDSGALALQAASRMAPSVASGAMTAATNFMNLPNAPRIIQRTIGAGVRGVATALGASIGGVPGAVAGAAMSEGLTPTQQAIRGWIGREASKVAPALSSSEDAVANYIESMGSSTKNLGPAAIEYAKKAGRSVLYDEAGKPFLVPTESAAPLESIAPTVVSKTARIVGSLAKGLSVASGAQGVLDLAQMQDPKRADIGVLGVGSTPSVDRATIANVIEQGIQNAMKTGKTRAQAEALFTPYLHYLNK